VTVAAVVSEAEAVTVITAAAVVVGDTAVVAGVQSGAAMVTDVTAVAAAVEVRFDTEAAVRVEIAAVSNDGAGAETAGANNGCVMFFVTKSNT
jgi:hypothetical protein